MPTQAEMRAFSDMIEKRAIANRISVWEALNDYCQETDMEHVVAASLLTKPIRELIKVEVQDLNLLRGTGKKGARLPI